MTCCDTSIHLARRGYRVCMQWVKVMAHLLQKSINSAVKMCCRFLSMFARVNTDNQRALFPSIRRLLKHSEEHPGEEHCTTDHMLTKS